jgi:hypothetical protein
VGIQIMKGYIIIPRESTLMYQGNNNGEDMRDY